MILEIRDKMVDFITLELDLQVTLELDLTYTRLENFLRPYLYGYVLSHKICSPCPLSHLN